ncbi:MAG: CehA/McbA family metallohydrolase [Planctomycetota bacterium]
MKRAKEGTTYALLDLEQVPDARTVTHLAFHSEADAPPDYTYALTFEAAPRGQLAIDVVDEAGGSTPVLLQLASADANKLWEPAEAVDLRSVLNDVVPHLGHTGRGYQFHLPGDRRGRYWIVNPPLEMPLPEGDWDIRVLRGLEYTPIRKQISVQSNQWTRVTLQPKRWTNSPARGWYSGDDHVHARLQTSEDARKLLTYARAVDIHVANILEMGDVMRTYYAQRGFGSDFRVQQGDHWLVPGQEDPRSVLGHAIGLNLQSKVRDVERYLDNRWIASEIHRQGGLYGHTHVGPNACFVHREMALFTPHEIVDFNSIMQASLGLELYYDFLNMGFKMTATAGADTPYGGTIGAVRTYAFVGQDTPFTPDAWFEAIRQGRTFVTNGPMLDLRIGDHLPGDEIIVDETCQMQVTAKAWGDTGWSAPARLRLVKLGTVIEEVEADPANPEALTISLDLTTDRGFWLAAHAVGEDGSEAHTTPIYVTRKGYRHWNPENAEGLIHAQHDPRPVSIRLANLWLSVSPASRTPWPLSSRSPFSSTSAR